MLPFCVPGAPSITISGSQVASSAGWTLVDIPPLGLRMRAKGLLIKLKGEVEDGFLMGLLFPRCLPSLCSCKSMSQSWGLWELYLQAEDSCGSLVVSSPDAQVRVWVYRMQLRDAWGGGGMQRKLGWCHSQTTASLRWEAEAVWSIWSVICTLVLPKMNN